jgi:UDP:flavonoid glycosyltransferase YjiC (YdhE family)
VFLWGDSFAAHLTQFFDNLPNGLVQATMSSCFPNSSLTPFEGAGTYSLNWAEKCNKFANDAFQYALNSKNIKYVVISSTFSWPYTQKNVLNRSETVGEY